MNKTPIVRRVQLIYIHEDIRSFRISILCSVPISTDKLGAVIMNRVQRFLRSAEFRADPQIFKPYRGFVFCLIDPSRGIRIAQRN